MRMGKEMECQPFQTSSSSAGLVLLAMILVQAGLCALLGTGLGLGLCGIIGQIAVTKADYPFRMMWFTPLAAVVMVLLVSVVAAVISARPVLKMEPGVVFAGR